MPPQSGGMEINMNETIQIAIISAGLATLINCIFQLVNKLIDNSKENKENKDKKKSLYIDKKEKVYIAAIGRLLQIRRGFDYTREMVNHNKQILANIEKENMEFSKIAPQLRLYSTDKIFNKYLVLAKYASFAYAPQTGPRLIVNNKWAYDMQITLLARLMQEDLGYRKYNTDYDVINCPECGCRHDMISKCPQCGLTFDDLQKKIEEILAHDITEENSQQDS